MMSKIVRAILISAYCALIFHILKSFVTDRHKKYLEINYVFRTSETMRKINREVRKNATLPEFQRPERLQTDLKYILKWTEAYSHYSAVFKNGQQPFLDHNCTYYNCLMTNDKTLVTDPKYFDAILFDVENNWDFHPALRNLHQKYIFMASESSDYYPICSPYFDSYYNWTWTYKLDSDIRLSYLTILDKNGRVVGPKINMSWITPMEPAPENVKDILKSKRKAVAWFVSNCHSKNKREKVAKNLSKSLSKYNLKIDIYGWCGNLTCPKDRIDECLDLLRTDYYFYLAFENSNCEDYVTEKILYPLQHYTVPIVYGGANYSRFLPPGSYIHAGKLDSETIASLIHRSIKYREEYYKYFKWHNYYTYKKSPQEADVCVLCKMLNDHTKNVTIVKNLRKWWNPRFRKVCKKDEDKKPNIIEVV